MFVFLATSHMRTIIGDRNFGKKETASFRCSKTTKMMINRRLFLPALIALAGHHAHAFTPAALGRTGNVPRFSMVASDVDVSVEYDAAARLAYNEWCAKFGKESSESKFEAFKANYEALTVANVSAAKKARDNGTDRPKDLELNEFGDMTEEEYLMMQSGGSASSEKGALETVMEASAAQSEASSALYEAASALAKEEEVRLYLQFVFNGNFIRIIKAHHGFSPLNDCLPYRC